MATWSWYQNQVGDWFTSGDWYLQPNGGSTGHPVSGDTAFVTSGTVSLASGESLSGITLDLASSSASAPAVFDVTSATIGTGFVLSNFVNGGDATFISRGNTSFAGSLQAATTGVSFAVSIASGTLTNSGTFVASNDGTLGLIAASGASLANSGVIEATSGSSVSIQGAITGTGHLIDQGSLAISGAVAAGQTLDMSSGNALVLLSTPASFAGSITGFTASDTIDLVGTTATATVYSNGTLTVSNGSTQVAKLLLPGGATLNAFSDGSGGTILSEEQLGTPDQVVSFMTGVNNNGSLNSFNFWAWNGNTTSPSYSSSNGFARDWNPGTISFTFDASSNWTTAEENVFQQAMGLWSDVANVHFTNVTSGGALSITRGAAGTGAFGGSTYSYTNTSQIAHNTAGTLSIDTTGYGFALSNFGSGQTEFSYVGGYDLLTVIHELGHVLGLGHPGPYNEGDGTPQAIYYTDTRQYSVMSYFGAASPTDDTLAGTTEVATTPQLYDIMAVQRLYGASTNTVLNTGQTFGFHSTSGLASFDFTQNTNPVVTLFDTASNNTLDLSGFASMSTIDLLPGSFSSTDGMVDDLAIYYATRIDTAIGSSGGNVFVVNADSDTVTGGGSTNTVVFPNAFATYSFSRTGSVLSVIGGGLTDKLTSVQTLQFSDRSVTANSVGCFAGGTRILTRHGECPVEALRVGDVVPTLHPTGLATIRWIGHRHVDLRRHPHSQNMRPVRVEAGAFGPGAPIRELTLSPDHAVFLDGALIPIRCLTNGASIAAQDADSVTYWHIELDRHAVLLAEGLPAESYLDTGNRDDFANGPIVVAHPDFSRQEASMSAWATQSCAPLSQDGPAVLRHHARLLHRAAALGHARATSPGLHLRAGSQTLRPRIGGNGILHVTLPAGAGSVRLRSRSGIPEQLDRSSRDGRRLGVKFSRILLDGQHLAEWSGTGWHHPEPDGRWTDGDATLLLSPSDQSRELILHMTGATPGWRRRSAEAAGPVGRKVKLRQPTGHQIRNHPS